MISIQTTKCVPAEMIDIYNEAQETFFKLHGTDNYFSNYFEANNAVMLVESAQIYEHMSFISVLAHYPHQLKRYLEGCVAAKQKVEPLDINNIIAICVQHEGLSTYKKSMEAIQVYLTHQ